MKVITQGHRYELDNFDQPTKQRQTLQFIEKGPISTEDKTLITINDGTTNEEVIAVLLDRMDYLQYKFPCTENAMAITKLQEALMWLNKRTQDRIKRNVEGTNQM